MFTRRRFKMLRFEKVPGVFSWNRKTEDGLGAMAPLSRMPAALSAHNM